MAEPNIVGVSSINGRTVANTPTGTVAVTLVNNPNNSSQVFKVNTVVASNLDGANPINCSVAYVSNTGVSYYIANTISVPANATLIVMDKSTSVYLEQNTSISVTSGTASKLAFISSYEIIS